jgi:D-2-hydroxyacid dehydrogenase (NADP+)
MAATVLYCSDAFWDEHGERVVAVDPTVEVVRLVADEHITPGDIDRITVAHFSPDLWPSRTKAFLSVCLRAPNLRWMQSMTAGTDDPVFGRLQRNGVALTNAVGAAAPSIAQTVMLYLLALGRELPRLLRSQAQRRWDPVIVTDLDGMRLAIVGMGAIGGHVARLAEPFGMRCIGLRRRPRGDEPCETWPAERLHELLGWADAVVVTAPLNDGTAGMLDRSAFAAMRPGTWFVNVGRGEVVDEDALVAALRSGHLGGAGLDVFATEPLAPDSALWSMPNVIVTPHSSGSSLLADRRVNELFLDNFERWTRGEPMRNVVDA